MTFKLLAQLPLNKVNEFMISQLIIVLPLSDDSSYVEIVYVIKRSFPCAKIKFFRNFRFHGVHPAVAVGRVGLRVGPLVIGHVPMGQLDLQEQFHLLFLQNFFDYRTLQPFFNH